MFAMNGLRRPNRSASTPNSSAPNGRMARVAVIVQMIAPFETWKWTARVSTRKTSTKKSNASSVHPKKLAITACHCSTADRVGERRVDFFGEVISGVSLQGLIKDRHQNTISRTDANASGRILVTYLDTPCLATSCKLPRFVLTRRRFAGNSAQIARSVYSSDRLARTNGYGR